MFQTLAFVVIEKYLGLLWLVENISSLLFRCNIVLAICGIFAITVLIVCV